MFCLNQSMLILSLFWISVSAPVMGHAPFHGVHSDDSSLGPPCPQSGGFCGGWRGQDKVKDLGAGGPQTGIGEGLTKHR